ncbi:ShlB/FhaC/HecB family hemolysin secretion/activation protein [Rhizobacter sp. Root1221]|uniref:ShlB/FhaC/HecB family hemolysin secretion/activation protein n=1 Tax=Rhizobacter sp. Root1221 TaxID=1736433 RepID=UPI000A5A8DEA|nr:ShlB/FhaC/HecB family hemolysin secretion/activation protein [Rhizobacter sp. Root1221]
MKHPLALCVAAALAALAAAPAGAQAPAPAVAAARFTLTRVVFPPTTAVPAHVLQQAAEPFIGKDTGAAELDQLSAALRRLYEDRGFGLVGIGFPSQALAGGVLQVAIVEPRVTRLIVESPDKPPVTDERTRAVLERNGVTAGQPLNLLHLDRAMYTLNDWPGVKAKATLTPSGDENVYSVAVQTERGRAWDASIDADNHGTEVSGKYRVGALLRWNNPAGIGDNLDLRLVASEGSGNMVGRLGYEAPVGPTPWRAGVGYSRVNYELGGTFDGAVGTADVVDASLSYPLLRSRDINVISRLSMEHKTLRDEFFTESSDKKITAGTAQVSFESRDTLWGGGFNGGSAGIMVGRLRNQATSGVDTTALGGFTKLTAQATRLQRLTGRFSFFAGIAGQWASQNLDNAEKLTLGGARGVRGYPAAEGASDQGAIVNTELRWWLNPQWSTFVFYDAAHGKLRREPEGTDDNTRTLHAAGLGVQFTNPELFTLKATLGVRGHDPVLSDTDNTGRSLLLVQLQHSF